MRLQAFFTYYGGKHSSVKEYPYPSTASIIEPFAGSAAYSTLYYGRKVVLNDLDPVIHGIWSYLIKVKESEFLSLPIVDSMEDAAVCEEAKWLIGFRLGGGEVRPKKNASTWSKSGIRPGCHWSPVLRARLAAQLQYIRHWKITNKTYTEIPNERATWFIDPPYDNKAGRQYTFNAIEYDHLGEWSRNRQGIVIVCENVGATWLPFRPFMKTAKGSKRKGKSEEAIWTTRN